jgi:glyoxylase-like metal-dependent hydrolase (beta-lactamase superfamily II)
VFSEIDRAVVDPANGRAGAVGDGPFVFADSIAPILEAGQEMLVKGGENLGDVLTITPSPGHTPGHFSIELAAGERRAVFSGDLMHHPIQVYNPSWNSAFCEDPDQARRSRGKLLEEIADTGAILCPAHFAGDHCCTVARQGSGFRCDSVHPGAI